MTAIASKRKALRKLVTLGAVLDRIMRTRASAVLRRLSGTVLCDCLINRDSVL